MLARDYDFQQAAGNATSKTAIEKFHGERENWLEFCMFPDIVSPVRMPSLFPVPTHIVRRQHVFTITPTAANLYCMWKPHTIQTSDGLNFNEARVLEGYRSAFHYTNNSAFIDSNSDAIAAANTSQENFTSQYTPSLLGAGGLVHGGARMIGGFVEVEYIGTLDSHAGIIECGLHMHSANNPVDLTRVHMFNQGEMMQAPFYRKFKPSDGVRCVWFPVDDENFSFQDFDINLDGTGEVDPDSTNQTTQAGVNQRLKLITLRTPVYPEWGINLTGLTINQAIRVHICSYYETVPDENVRDIYMAAKTKNFTDTGKLKSAVTEAVQSEMVATSAKSSSGFGGFKDKAMQYLDAAQVAYGVYSGARSALGALGMFAG